jgi:predicted RNA-binding protein with RPS1 domain
VDEKPVLYKIYNGKVSGMKDFGAFVTLEGVAGRSEGMFYIIHISSPPYPFIRHGARIEYPAGCSCQ